MLNNKADMRIEFLGGVRYCKRCCKQTARQPLFTTSDDVINKCSRYQQEERKRGWMEDGWMAARGQENERHHVGFTREAENHG